MVSVGDTVKYIGHASNSYLDAFGVGKKGKVISEPYQLKNAGDMEFVDVDWFFEKRDPLALLTDKPGHVVNVANLEILK